MSRLLLRDRALMNVLSLLWNQALMNDLPLLRNQALMYDLPLLRVPAQNTVVLAVAAFTAV